MMIPVHFSCVIKLQGAQKILIGYEINHSCGFNLLATSWEIDGETVETACLEGKGLVRHFLDGFAMIKKTRVVSEFSGCSLPPCYGCRRPQPCETSPLRNITVELQSDLTMWTASDFLYVAHLGSPVTKKKNKNCQERISPALGIFWVHHLSIASGGLGCYCVGR